MHKKTVDVGRNSTLRAEFEKIKIHRAMHQRDCILGHFSVNALKKATDFGDNAFYKNYFKFRLSN